MTLHSTSDSSSILEGGKLKPGIYKIQNIQCETYLDIEVHTREVCCRAAKSLGEGRGLWEIKSFGAGYTIQRVEPGKPEQFCILLGKLGECDLSVAPYPVAWRVDVVNNEKHRGHEYVSFYWGNTTWMWSLKGASKEDGTKVWPWSEPQPVPRQMWKLIPVKVESTFTPSPLFSEVPGSGSPPLYDGGSAGQSSTRAQHVESEQDEFGTIVNEVTVVTTNSTVTTRKRYRVEDV